MAKYKPHLNQVKHYTKVRLLQFIEYANCSEEETRDFVSELCSSCLPNLKTFRLKDLERLAVSLFFINHKDINAWFGPHIAEAMLACNWSNVKSGMSFVYLTTVLAKMGCQVEDSMDLIIKAANDCNMEELDTDEGISE